MQRRRLLALAGTAVGLDGCLGSPSTATETEPSPAAGPVSAAYRVRPGPVAEGVAGLRVEFGVYLAERRGEAIECTEGAPLMANRYDPTPTPLPRPEGECRGFRTSLDVTGLDGERTLGPFEADARFDGGHTLVVHDAAVVLDDGTRAEKVRDTDFRVFAAKMPPERVRGVELGVRDTSDSDAAWNYLVLSRPFDP